MEGPIVPSVPSIYDYPLSETANWATVVVIMLEKIPIIEVAE